MLFGVSLTPFLCREQSHNHESCSRPACSVRGKQHKQRNRRQRTFADPARNLTILLVTLYTNGPITLAFCPPHYFSNSHIYRNVDLRTAAMPSQTNSPTPCSAWDASSLHIPPRARGFISLRMSANWAAHFACSGLRRRMYSMSVLNGFSYQYGTLELRSWPSVPPASVCRPLFSSLSSELGVSP